MKSLAALRLSFTWLLGFLMFYYSMILKSCYIQPYDFFILFFQVRTQ